MAVTSATLELLLATPCHSDFNGVSHAACGFDSDRSRVAVLQIPQFSYTYFPLNRDHIRVNTGCCFWLRSLVPERFWSSASTAQNV